MSLTGFARAGHLPTLIAALLYFDVSFMTWVLLGPLAPFLAEDLGLSASQQGLLTAIVTGIVGAAGGLGGFFLPSVLGAVRDISGSYAPGLFGCAAVFVAGTAVLLELGARWSSQWNDHAVRRAGVYSYRTAFGIDTERAA